MMLVIYGPTATGKTNLAIEIAKKNNGELISADSRQVYKNLDIGTGKVSPNSNVKKYNGHWFVDGVKIYGFDVIAPGESFSAADFIGYANGIINNIQKKNKIPIIVGGTGFYIKSLLFGIETLGIAPNYTLRKKLDNLTKTELYKTLFKLNRNKAISLNESDRKNPRRLIRAIEIAVNNSYSITSIQTSPANYEIIGLTAPNDFLYKRADAWLIQRLDLGLIDEVKYLLSNRISSNWLQSLGLEYKWITRSLLGEISQNEAISRLKGDIHAYIRRQKTFSRQFPKIKYFDISERNWKHNLQNLSL